MFLFQAPVYQLADDPQCLFYTYIPVKGGGYFHVEQGWVFDEDGNVVDLSDILNNFADRLVFVCNPSFLPEGYLSRVYILLPDRAVIVFLADLYLLSFL